MAQTRSKPKRMNDLIKWEIVEQIDEDCAERREFSLKDVLMSEEYDNDDTVQVLTGEDLTVEYLQREGFNAPIMVKQRDNLELEIPPKFHSREFGMENIKSFIGSRRKVDALDTKTQKTQSMTMQQWYQFWVTFPRKQILNGISLEFSLTKMDPHIVPPRIVRQIDWIEKAWPRHLKQMQKDFTNNLEDMMYPKVQKFMIMSVASSYMDFHLDFGGTSVWYYLLRGMKIFWLIPPTDENLLKYEQWVKCEEKTKFLADITEGCVRLEVLPGNTVFLPAGWIHAVFSVKDSIAFSGSFLHSFGIENQLKVNYIEESLGVMEMHRFPFFTEMMWYVVDRYVTCLTGQSCLDLPEEEKRRMRLERGDHIDPNKEFLYSGLVNEAPKVPIRHVHMTQCELEGLKYIAMYLFQLPADQRKVPDIIPDPAQLIENLRALLEKHKNDKEKDAVTGKYILRWNKKDNVDVDFKQKKLIPKPKRRIDKDLKNPFQKNYTKAMAYKRGTADKPTDAPKKRRRRCMECDGCKLEDCRSCPPCRDMVKYGGLGRVRQSCVRRRCARPSLPVAAACSVCGLDGWNEAPDYKKAVDLSSNPSNLFECISCFDILHQKCAKQPGEIVYTLSNCWTCHECQEKPNEPMDETK